MTRWGDWPARHRIEALVAAPQAGEAENGALVAAELAVFAERVHAYAPESFETAVSSVVHSILATRPASAPLLTLVNSVLLSIGRAPETVVAEVRSVAERLRTSVGILAAMGAAFVPDGGTVLAHGTSSSVRSVLERAAATKAFRVVCEEGGSGAGEIYAVELADVGIAVELVDEDMVVDSLLAVDLVVTGAFAFGSEMVVNRVGTDAILKEAANLDLRALLVASADKALPQPLMTRALGAATERSGLEAVRLRAYEAVVTELGVLDSIAVGRLADRKEVVAELQ